jgi:predicted nucleic acid-binding protein
MNSAMDSCVALKWVLAEPDSARALQLLDDFQNQVRVLLAQDVFPVEVAHALTRAERRGLITAQEGSAKFSDILAALPDLYPSLPLLPRAYDLSSTFRIGVYDCLYVALAEREGCEFITADDRLVRALGPTFPFILSLASLP